MRTFEAVRRRLSYANVMATVAVFFALTGSAVAASPFVLSTDTIPATSDLAGSTYGNPQIAAGKVTTGKIANGAITTAKFDGSALAPDSDKLDGLDSSAYASAGSSYTKGESDGRYLGINAKAANAELLDGLDSLAFLGVNAKAADSDKLDGIDSTGFLGVNAKAADSDKLDGNDSTAFLGANAKAADSDKLDGLDSSAFALAGSAKPAYVKSADVDIAGVSNGSVSVNCDNGDHAAGGGFRTGSDAAYAFQSSPTTTPTSAGWQIGVHNGALATRTATVFVICADVA